MPNGYGQIHHKGKTAYAHRVAWELAHGEIPEGGYILHSCDNRRCVNHAHMRVGSFQDNMDDMTRRKRHAYGERNGHAKLTEHQVRDIREAEGTHKHIAKLFGVTQPLVSMIKSRRIWSNV